METPSWARQRDYDVSLRWGKRGAQLAAEHGDALVVVDVLSFSTAVSYALAAGATVRPCAWDEDLLATAERESAIAAQSRHAARESGGFSLSPTAMQGAPEGARIVLASPNGATCCRAAPHVPQLIVGSLTNAGAAASAVRDGPVTVLACGERWPDDTLRVALEDYLGAGAIIDALPGTRSPEAETCAAAFRAQRSAIATVLRECASGRELVEIGFGNDVDLASAVDALDVVPAMRDGWLVPA